ncbi:unnamed protein product [Spodoptera exigua]|nr:unnamed protein product [Spodoptera exigua]
MHLWDCNQARRYCGSETIFFGRRRYGVLTFRLTPMLTTHDSFVQAIIWCLLKVYVKVNKLIMLDVPYRTELHRRRHRIWCRSRPSLQMSAPLTPQQRPPAPSSTSAHGRTTGLRTCTNYRYGYTPTPTLSFHYRSEFNDRNLLDNPCACPFS